jgi:hypothetical protein
MAWPPSVILLDLWRDRHGSGLGCACDLEQRFGMHLVGDVTRMMNRAKKVAELDVCAHQHESDAVIALAPLCFCLVRERPRFLDTTEPRVCPSRAREPASRGRCVDPRETREDLIHLRLLAESGIHLCELDVLRVAVPRDSRLRRKIDRIS